jgi:hypothetical protein
LIEITLLVQALLPVAFCLQETHLKKSDNINLKHYSVYSTYVDEDERAAGGSTGRSAWTSNVISIKLTFRPRQFHWMIEAIMGVGSGKSFPSVENPSAVL